MMKKNEIDKIRILWIDDRERISGFPEIKLNKELSEWFEVAHPSSDSDVVMSYESVEAFMEVFESFWSDLSFKRCNQYFPVEIIATDYNLKKSSAADQGSKRTATRDDMYGSNKSQIPSDSSDKMAREVNFDGLLIGTFYATLTAHHPAAIVSITNYMGKMPSEVKTLHGLATPFLGVDFEHNLPSLERSWQNIINEGVKHLRRRIHNLYELKKITISPTDLMDLAESADHDKLTIYSQYAERKLPVKGLFIDKTEDPQEWAQNLLGLMINSKDFKQAIKLSDMVWEAYNDNELVESRNILSKLSLENKKGNSKNAEYKNLLEKFNVSGNNCKSNFIDIRSGDFSARIRRWAALFITLKLITRLIHIKKHVEEYIHQITDESLVKKGPNLDKNDIYLALFPVPKNPLILPWDEGIQISTDHAWAKAMMSWKQVSFVKNNVGDLALLVPDLLNGKSWAEEGPYGVTESERIILTGLALENSELDISDWQRYEYAQSLLWGSV